MRLHGPADRLFQLAVVEYQFPNAVPSGPGDDFDANWLVVDMVGVDGDQRRALREPALLTWELERLIAWFEAIAARESTSAGIDFLEPTLAFELMSTSGDEPRLRVGFLEEDDEGYFRTEIPLTSRALHAAIEDLRHDLDRFPVRR